MAYQKKSTTWDNKPGRIVSISAAMVEIVDSAGKIHNVALDEKGRSILKERDAKEGQSGKYNANKAGFLIYWSPNPPECQVKSFNDQPLPAGELAKKAGLAGFTAIGAGGGAGGVGGAIINPSITVLSPAETQQKEKAEGEQRMRENEEYLKQQVAERQKTPIIDGETGQPLAKQEKTVQNADTTPPKGVVEGAVKLAVHIDLGSYSNFDLEVNAISGEHARALLEQESKPVIALCKRIMRDAKEGY